MMSEYVQSPENNVLLNHSESQQILVNRYSAICIQGSRLLDTLLGIYSRFVSFSFHWDALDQTNISFVFIRHK